MTNLIASPTTFKEKEIKGQTIAIEPICRADL